VLADRRRAWRNAAICTVASVLGGMLGYAIGYFLRPAGLWLLAITGNSGGLEAFQAWFAEWGVWVILIKGLTPIPYKLVTIASGLAEFNFAVFVAASVVTRGARFFIVAGLLKLFGPPIQAFVEKRLTLVTSLVAVLIVGGVILLKFLEH
jgi:membrane protein YqaA with SNARE-associated domain